MSAPPPTCPRCAYDLSAAIVAWDSSCPLDGRCWECGLSLQWADVLREDRRVNLRHVEHAVGTGGVSSASWRSLGWTLWPPLFWSRVRLEHYVVPGRLWRWLLTIVGALWLAHAVLVLLITGRQHGWGLVLTFRDDITAAILNPILAPMGMLFQDWTGGMARGYTFAPAWKGTLWGPAYVPLLAFTLMFALMMLVLKDTRARAKVLRAHVLRATVFGLAWLLPLIGLAMAAAAFEAWASTPARFWALYITIGSRSYEVSTLAGYALLLPAAAWIAWWWWAALSRGWRIERPFAAWGSALVASLLALAVVLALDTQFVYLFVA